MNAVNESVPNLPVVRTALLCLVGLSCVSAGAQPPLSPTEAFAGFTYQLGSADQWTRCNAAEELGSLAVQVKEPGLLAAAVAPLIRVLRTDEVARARAVAAGTLERVAPKLVPGEALFSLIQPLAQALADTDPDASRNAAFALRGVAGQAGPAEPLKTGLETMVQTLKNPQRHARVSAALAVASCVLVDDDESEMRLPAPEALAAAVPGLVEGLTDVDRPSRWRCAAWLGGLGLALKDDAPLAPAFDPLIAATTDDSPYVRSNVLNSLGTLAASLPDAALRKKAVDSALKRLDDEYSFVQHYAARALGHLGAAAASEAELAPLLPVLEERLSGDSSYARSGAAMALGLLLPKVTSAKPRADLVDKLLAACTSNSSPVRESAASAVAPVIREMDPKAAAPLLAGKLRAWYASGSSYARVYAPKVLGELLPKGSHPAHVTALIDELTRDLGDESEAVRAHAILAIGAAANACGEAQHWAQASAAIEKLADDSDRLVRSALALTRATLKAASSKPPVSKTR